MSVDITLQPFQEEIGDSILESPLVAQFTHEGNFGHVPRPEYSEGQESVFDDAAESIYEGIEDRKDDADLFHIIARREEEQNAEDTELERQEKLVLSPEERIVRRMDREEREPRETQETQQEPPQQQPAQALTPEAVEAGIQRLDAIVREHGLNDAASANEFATAFCESFGTDLYKSGINVEALGSVMAKASLSALRVYEASGGDPARVPAMPDASAKAFTHDIMRGLGIDPRAVPVDEQLLANTVMRASLNFLDTYNRYGGKVSDLAKLNDAGAAEMFLGNFLKAFGVNGPVDRASALKFADASGKYLLSMRDKVLAWYAAEQAKQQPRGKSRGQRVPARFREGLKGCKAPVFESNRDVFSPAVIEAATSRNL